MIFGGCLKFQQSLTILSVCCRTQIKTLRISSLFRFHEVWATAYLEMVNFFSTAVMISASYGLFKVIKACCTDQTARLSISWCLKSLFVVRCPPRSSYKVSPDWRPPVRFNKRTNNRNNGP